MSEYATDDAEALAEAIYDAVGFHAADSWATETSIQRGHYEGMAEALLASGFVRPAADVRAEALEQAADDLAARLDTFLQQGRHTRARWAEQMLRDWAAAMGGAQ